MFIFIWILLLFSTVFSSLSVNRRLPNQHVSVYGSIDVDIPKDTFHSSNSSRIYSSLDSSSENHIKESIDVDGCKLINEYIYVKPEESVVINDIAYVAAGYGIFTLNVSNFSDISLIGRMSVTGGCIKIRVSGDYAYLGSNNGYITVVNIADPANPTEVSSIQGKFSTKGIVVQNNGNDRLMYYGDYYGVTVVNITDIGNPVKYGTYSVISKVQDIVVSDQFVFVTLGGDGFKVINFTNLHAPVEIGSLGLGGDQVKGMCSSSLHPNFVFACGGTVSSGFRSIEVTNPILPKDGSKLTFYAKSCFAVGNTVFVVGHLPSPTLSILNITNPLSMSIINTVSTTTTSYGVFAKTEDLVFLSHKDDGLDVYEGSNHNRNYSRVGDSRNIIGGSPRDMVITEDRNILFVNDFNKGIKIYDIRENSKTYLVGNFGSQYQYEISKMEPHKDFLLCVILQNTFYYFQILKINQTNSSTTLELKNITKIPQDIISIASSDDGFAYFSNTREIWNISDTSNIRVVGYMGTLNSGGNYIVVSGNFCYIHSTPTLYIYDISDRTSPKFVSSNSEIFPAIYGIIISDVNPNLAFVALRSDGVQAVDISDKTNIKLLGKFDTIAAGTLSSYGHLVGVADGTLAKVLDFSDLSNPKLVMEQKMSSVDEVLIRDDYVFVIDKVEGIQIFQLQIQAKSTSLFDSSFCGTMTVSVNGKEFWPKISSISESFSVTKDDFCNSRGTCLDDRTCSCEGGYGGDYCENWKCGAIMTSLSTCSGNGRCISPDVCVCNSGFDGDQCEINLWLSTVLPSMLSTSFAAIVGIVIAISLLICCAICVCACFTLVCFCYCGVCILGSVCCLLARFAISLRKYGKLENFDLLLTEQLLEADTTIPRLNFNRKLFEVDFSDIKTFSILGEGGSNSIVFKSKWRGKWCAFKCFKTRILMSSQHTFDEFEKEVELLSSLSHPNIVRFFGACLNPPRIGILMELCTKGEILKFIIGFREKNVGIRYPFYEVLRLLGEVASSLDFLHSKNVIHRDLKCENVLISEDEHAKLMDFGLSKLVQNMSQDNKTTRIGTSIYMAPEIVLAGSNYDEKIDVFSYAIMAYCLLTENKNPYGGKTFRLEFKVANDPKFRPDLKILEENIPEDFEWISEMIEKCWDHEPNVRWSCHQICEKLEEQGQSGEGMDVQRSHIVKKRPSINTSNVSFSSSRSSEIDLPNQLDWKSQVFNLQEEVAKLKLENELLRVENMELKGAEN